MGKPNLNEEELKRLLEEQKKKVEAMLAAMTPEERADAEKKFAAMREADEDAMGKTLDDARKVMEMNTAQEHHKEGYYYEKKDSVSLSCSYYVDTACDVCVSDPCPCRRFVLRGLRRMEGRQRELV